MYKVVKYDGKWLINILDEAGCLSDVYVGNKDVPEVTLFKGDMPTYRTSGVVVFSNEKLAEEYVKYLSTYKIESYYEYETTTRWWVIKRGYMYFNGGEFNKNQVADAGHFNSYRDAYVYLYANISVDNKDLKACAVNSYFEDRFLVSSIEGYEGFYLFYQEAPGSVFFISSNLCVYDKSYLGGLFANKEALDHRIAELCNTGSKVIQTKIVYKNVVSKKLIRYMLKEFGTKMSKKLLSMCIKEYFNG